MKNTLKKILGVATDHRGNFYEKLKLHVKLEFHEVEFQKGGKLLNISQTMIDC